MVTGEIVDTPAAVTYQYNSSDVRRVAAVSW